MSWLFREVILDEKIVRQRSPAGWSFAIPVPVAALCVRNSWGVRRPSGFAASAIRIGTLTPLIYKMFTARAAGIARVVSDTDACSIISTLAQRESTGTSVGEKAVLVLNARKR